MFCNTPGNGADDHVLLNSIGSDGVVISEAQTAETECEVERDEQQCNSDYCESDWKPQRDLIA